MIISHKNKFVMLEAWKTASQTLRARLRDHNESQYPGFFHFNPHLNRVVHQHITRAELQCDPRRVGERDLADLHQEARQYRHDEAEPDRIEQPRAEDEKEGALRGLRHPEGVS